MRWMRPHTGDKRVVKRFAIFPISIDGEVRWFEWCKIRQEAYDIDWYLLPWRNIEFINRHLAEEEGKDGKQYSI